jgi:hypothetical protein
MSLHSSLLVRYPPTRESTPTAFFLGFTNIPDPEDVIANLESIRSVFRILEKTADAFTSAASEDG